MTCLLNLIFVTIFCIKCISGDKTCGGDAECIKSGAKLAYPLFIEGIDDLVASSDPLFVEYINADSEKLKYRIRNATLIGMKDCFLTHLAIQEHNNTFQYYLECPRINSAAQYTLSGYIGEMFIEGEGALNITAENYEFQFSGVYEKRKGEDDKDHAFIKNYTLETDAKGKVTFHFENLFGGDCEKSEAGNKYINENWRLADKELGAHIHTYMKKFIYNLNGFLGLTACEEVFPKTSAV